MDGESDEDENWTGKGEMWWVWVRLISMLWYWRNVAVAASYFQSCITKWSISNFKEGVISGQVMVIANEELESLHIVASKLIFHN